MIHTRLASSRWESLHAGVYRVAGTPSSWHQRLAAAVLACGSGATASHRSAAQLQRVPGGAKVVEVMVPRGRRVRRRGMLVHESDLDRIDVTVVEGIRVTGVPRTLIDLASVVSAAVLEEALDDALRRRLTSVGQLRRRLEQLGTRGRSRAGLLAGLVDARSTRAVPESPLETRFLRLLRRAKLTLPAIQYEIRDGGRLLARVDFAYPALKLAIEIDGYRWHSGRAKWERDLARRNALMARGWRILHVTSTDLDGRSGDLLAWIAHALNSR